MSTDDPSSAADAAVPDLEALLARCRDGAVLLGSTHHGERHWRAVARTGIEIHRADPGCDPTVLLLFAVLHDARRFSEHRDPEHGPRAAVLASELLRDGVIRLDDARAALLDEACRLHDTGTVSDDPTIGACYDADRLQLQRLGITPDPALLSRPVSRDPAFVARCAPFDAAELTWAELLAQS